MTKAPMRGPAASTSLQLIALAATLATAPLSAQVTVTGTLVDRSTLGPIAGAIVRVSGSSALTDSLGRFRFNEVPVGAQIISARAIGFAPVSLRVDLRGDTTVQLRAVRNPTMLDTMVVHGRTVTVSGTLVDSISGSVILHGQVRLYPGAGPVGASSGHFRLAGIPAGVPVLLSATGLEHLPKDIELAASKDTSIVIYLAIDSVALRMIAQQVARLADRAAIVPISRDALDRTFIHRSGTMSIADLIKRRLPTGVIRERYPYVDREKTCIFFDDRQVEFQMLLGLVPEIVERVEIFGREGRMIRVYSRRYVADLQRTASLPRIEYSPYGLHQACG
jgi:hypothetical protein